MPRNIVFLALALALVSAVEEDAFGEALATIKLMKSQGLGTNECQALADSSLKAVNGDKDTSQTLLNSLSTGSECAQSGQTEVAAATQKLNDATDAATTAKSALDKANAVVPAIAIPSMSALMSMGESCDFFHKSDAVILGKAAVTTAQAKKTNADAQVVSYAAALQAAKDAATKMAKKCRCDAKTNLASQWAIVSNPTTAASQKSEWDKAQNILCALSGKSPCNAPAVPTVVKPTLSADTEAETCDGVVVIDDATDPSPWSLTSGAQTEDGFAHGPFAGGESQALKKSFPLSPHTQLRIKARIWFIDSWDGEAMTLKVDNDVWWSMSRECGGPGGTCSKSAGVCNAGETSFKGQFPNPWNGDGHKCYVDVDVTKAHSGSSAVVKFSSTLDQATDDESYWVNRIKVYTSF